MTFQEHKKMYRSQHKTVGCKVTHMFGIPMIVTSLVLFFFNWPLALGLFVGGWALQFIGHFVFEKNRPVLFQDPTNPFTYFYAVIFVGEEWVRLFTKGTLKDDDTTR